MAIIIVINDKIKHTKQIRLFMKNAGLPRGIPKKIAAKRTDLDANFVLNDS